MTIHQNESEVSSQDCVELNRKIPPMTMQSKDRPKIQNDIGSKKGYRRYTKRGCESANEEGK